MPEKDVVLEVNDLHTYFFNRSGYSTAVDGASFTINGGETLGLSGESGLGKISTSKLLLRLEESTEGQIFLKGKDIQTFSGQEMKEYRTKVQAVFQDRWSLLSPRMKVQDIVSEAMVVNQDVTSKEAYDKVREVMEQVGLAPDQNQILSSGFSGGQRQRVAVASA